MPDSSVWDQRKATAGASQLPRVSVVIVNHNYGRFLAEAVASVREQSYPNIDCVIVDDASTDDSADVISAITAHDPTVRSVLLARNSGQTVASFAGLAVADGDFVVFLDADDLLMPDCIATHIYVHLSSRRHVGLTCVDMVQSRDGRVVVAGLEAMAHYLMQSGFRPAMEFRPADATGVWPLGLPGASILQHVAYVPPGRVGWCWSPTSGNCYRRDALALLEGIAGVEQLRLSTDVLFCAGISNLTGSLLIDRPMAIYRLHGANQGTQAPQLDHMRAIRPENEMSRMALKMLADHMVLRADEMVRRFWETDSFLRTIAAFDAVDGFDELIAGNREPLSRAVGAEAFDAWVRRYDKAPVAVPEPVAEALRVDEPAPLPEPLPEPLTEPLTEPIPAWPRRVARRAIRRVAHALRAI